MRGIPKKSKKKLSLKGVSRIRKASRVFNVTGVLPGWDRKEFQEHMDLQRQESRKIVRRTFMSEELEDSRVEDVLTEMHTIASAKYRIDPKTGKKVKVTHGSDPMGFTYSTKDRISAAKLFLDFKKAKPASSVNHNVTTAEDLLDELVKQHEEEADSEAPSIK